VGWPLDIQEVQLPVAGEESFPILEEVVVAEMTYWLAAGLDPM